MSKKNENALDKAREAFEARYDISGNVSWNGVKYVSLAPLENEAAREATILNNWFDVWCSATAWAVSENR